MMGDFFGDGVVVLGLAFDREAVGDCLSNFMFDLVQILTRLKDADVCAMSTKVLCALLGKPKVQMSWKSLWGNLPPPRTDAMSF
jgi:hypothetical protein